MLRIIACVVFLVWGFAFWIWSFRHLRAELLDSVSKIEPQVWGCDLKKKIYSVLNRLEGISDILLYQFLL